MVGALPVCCARAASGHAAAPPTSVTKSRRRMLSTRCASLAILTIKTRKGIRRNGERSDKVRCKNPKTRMTATGQKHELPRRSIAVRFAPNKQTLTERVQCDAMCHKATCAVQQKVRLFDHLVGDR